MKKTIHTAATRGHAQHGWLDSHHSFSFGSWFHPEKMGFGLLRVLNDDVVQGGAGFGTHPHRDMEIISIPLSGALEHKDSEGNQSVIQSGDVQLMSAGTGVFHSEYNHSRQELVNFLQIWVIPEKEGIAPRYDQKSFDFEAGKNQWETVVSPMGTSDPGVKINQQAWFSIVDLESENSIDYELKKTSNGVYIFVLEGEVTAASESLSQKDALGLEEVDKFTLKTEKGSRVLVIEVPMN